MRAQGPHQAIGPRLFAPTRVSSTMSSRRATQYQDPHAVESLSSALRAWQRLRTARSQTTPKQVIFTFSCWSESRAMRIAGFLRRRLDCAATRAHHVAGANRDTWHVHGSMHPAIQSLSSLESVWAWLHCAAHNHQVVLLRVSVTQSAA